MTALRHQLIKSCNEILEYQISLQAKWQINVFYSKPGCQLVMTFTAFSRSPSFEAGRDKVTLTQWVSNTMRELPHKGYDIDEKGLFLSAKLFWESLRLCVRVSKRMPVFQPLWPCECKHTGERNGKIQRPPLQRIWSAGAIFGQHKMQTAWRS